jgi:hypothetical protein
MVASWWLLPTLMLLAIGAAGCSSTRESTGEECSARFRWQGRVYDSGVRLVRTPFVGERFGRGVLIDCDGTPVDPIRREPLYELKGIDPSVAFTTGHDKAMAAAYVDEDLPKSQWPQGLAEAATNPVCTASTSFEGTWSWIDADSWPNPDNFDVEPPYTATFRATRGRHLSLDRWSAVEINVAVDAEVADPPDPALLRQAIDQHRKVLAQVRCRGDQFVARSIQMAP